ncbi:proline-rich receptor-like protein kinase PERK4 [Cynara cardunculus var. scolymus]|uniref:proline-rich receptor-like protein kinase PERK4 n=1 Tax=Cynara cardunculus var. scolymus TaxID=59895 RepID=UPI000D62BA09|nr:proline-rich receptor-like protein kinase PERK4 [Cynara cardunculus var. scolymus]
MAPAPQTAPTPKSSRPPPFGSSPPRGPPRSPPPPSSSSPPPRSPPPPSSSSPPPPRHQSPPPPTSKLHKSHSHKTPHRSTGGSSTNTTTEAIIIGLVLAGFVFLAFVTICVTCGRRKRKKQKAEAYYMKSAPGGDYYKNQWAGPPHEHLIKFKTPGMMGTPVGAGGRWATSPWSKTTGNLSASAVPPPNMPLAFSKSHFSYNELSAATDGFSQSNLLGQGGFGYVHKGVLPDGREVAVKSLKSGSNQGEREFQAEVEIISRVHHRHLVSLVGYCIADAQRMLVYEYVPNKALDFHLHGKGFPVMNWETRVRIALGSAKGLAYLHEDCHPRIIHRDIKSSNILLDHNFEAKVADFGLAKLSSGEDTHISTRVMGTFGYLAPEYASSGKLTEKSDVFSFGVMLLELLTGRKPIDPTSNQMEDSLVEWAGPLLAKALEDQNYNELVDPRLEGNYEPNEVARMACCAAASIRHSSKQRPKMSQIVRALEGSGSLDDILKPQRSGSMSNLNQSQDTPTSIIYDTKAYNDDMRKFKEMVNSSQEFTSN